ncbi:MAG TPA: PAS domain-containing protein, partial [Longimicrobiales bacterium]|nr:PAS domain-containing protein [Longimicrobiales bacterium]
MPATEGQQLRDIYAAARHASDRRYRALFDSVDQGVCVLQMIFDDDGTPVDYRFLETNPAFMEQTGLVDAQGRTARELVPDLEAHWFETYGRVATTGESIRFQSGSEPMGRWFDVFAFRVDDPAEHKVALLFRDVTEQRSAEREREQLVAALTLERQRLRDVFASAPGFMVAFRGRDHTYEFVNEAYYQLVGFR